MIAFLRALFRRKPVKIPGKYPWSVQAEAPLPWGTVLYRGRYFDHIADGVGGIVSVSTGKPKPPFPGRGASRRGTG